MGPSGLVPTLLVPRWGWGLALSLGQGRPQHLHASCPQSYRQAAADEVWTEAGVGVEVRSAHPGPSRCSQGLSFAWAVPCPSCPSLRAPQPQQRGADCSKQGTVLGQGQGGRVWPVSRETDRTGDQTVAWGHRGQY